MEKETIREKIAKALRKAAFNSNKTPTGGRHKSKKQYDRKKLKQEDGKQYER